MANKQTTIYRWFGNQSVQSPRNKVINLDQFVLYFVLMFIVGILVTTLLAYTVLGFDKTHGASFHLKGYGAIVFNTIMSGWFVDNVREYKTYIKLVNSHGFTFDYSIRLVSSIVASLGFAWWVSKNELIPRKNVTLTRGRELYRGEEAVKILIAKTITEISLSKPDIFIHPEIRFSYDRWTKHMFVVGAVGGGKTQFLLRPLKQIFANNEKLVLFDIKADYTEIFENYVLVAPWDKRSIVWNIAKDVRTKADARELAIRLIEESHDPMWSNAARQVFTGLVVSLQNNRGINWGWSDLKELLSISNEHLVTLMQEHNPEGLRAVDGAENTVSSIMVNLNAFMAIIFDMAMAWGDKAEIKEKVETEYESLLDKRIKAVIAKIKKDKNVDVQYKAVEKSILADNKIIATLKERADKNINFSFTDWLFDESKDSKKQIILQGNGRFDSMMKGLHSSIISLISSRINSPEVGDSTTRKIWFVLDEFPQLGKVNIGPMLELGRSKGVRVILACQDLGQVKKVYSQEDADAWMSLVGTQVFVKVAAGETADWVSGLIGNQEVEIRDLSTTISNQGVQNNSQSLSYKKEDTPVLLPSQLSSELGVEHGGVRVLVLGFDDVFIIKLPFVEKPTITARYVEADWVQAKEAMDDEAYMKEQQAMFALQKAKKLEKQLEDEKNTIVQPSLKVSFKLNLDSSVLPVDKKDGDGGVDKKKPNVSMNDLEDLYDEKPHTKTTYTLEEMDEFADTKEAELIARKANEKLEAKKALDSIKQYESNNVSMQNRNNAINEQNQNKNYDYQEEADDGSDMIADKVGTSMIADVIAGALGAHEIKTLIEIVKETGDMYNQTKTSNPRQASSNRNKIPSEIEKSIKKEEEEKLIEDEKVISKRYQKY